MKDTEGKPKCVVYSKFEVVDYLAKLKYALSEGKARINFQKKRKSDANRDERFTNAYTIANLFPNEDEKKVFKRELKKLTVENYIHTVDDKDYPELKNLWVFGIKYDDDVYIKMRVEIVESVVLVLSFHYAEKAFKDTDFPYKRKR